VVCGVHAVIVGKANNRQMSLSTDFLSTDESQRSIVFLLVIDISFGDLPTRAPLEFCSNQTEQ